jgi:hypothetical protein
MSANDETPLVQPADNTAVVNETPTKKNKKWLWPLLLILLCLGLAALVWWNPLGIKISRPANPAPTSVTSGWQLSANTGKTDPNTYANPQKPGQQADGSNQVYYTQSGKPNWQKATFVLDAGHAAIIDTFTILQGENEVTGGYIGVIVGPVGETSVNIFNGAVQIVPLADVQSKLTDEYFPKFCRGDATTDKKAWSYGHWALAHKQLAGYSFPDYPSSCPTSTATDTLAGSNVPPK